MKLTNDGIADRAAWEAKGYALPTFDRDTVAAATKKSPFWVHFGAGNLFRAFPAQLVQGLLNKGLLDRGIIAVSGHNYETIDTLYKPHDNLSIIVTLKSNGTVQKTVVGSVMEALAAEPQRQDDWEQLSALFRSPSLQMATFTITEKTYTVESNEADFAEGPSKPRSYMGKLAALLYERCLAGSLPLAMVSMDNCSHNSDRLYAAVRKYAQEWESRGLCDRGFLAYIDDKSRLSFPWTMTDKITPRPDAAIRKLLEQDGIEGLEDSGTEKTACTAPFVNAEECQYLVIEDAFPNGRPPLEKAGVFFTDRSTVDKVEKMKVCTCLNPLHTFLALSGCLLGYTRIADEMKDADLLTLVKKLGYEEGLPVVADPKIINPRTFIDEVVNIRIPNPFMPDTPQRIACDCSQKIPIRFGETVKGYLERSDLDCTKLRVIPFVFALWLRYLLAIDDEGRHFEPSPDPLLKSMRASLAGIQLGNTDAQSVRSREDAIAPLLHRAELFGADLYEAGLAEKVCAYFTQLCAGTGAVRTLLHKLSTGEA